MDYANIAQYLMNMFGGGYELPPQANMMTPDVNRAGKGGRLDYVPPRPVKTETIPFNVQGPSGVPSNWVIGKQKVRPLMGAKPGSFDLTDIFGMLKSGNPLRLG